MAKQYKGVLYWYCYNGAQIVRLNLYHPQSISIGGVRDFVFVISISLAPEKNSEEYRYDFCAHKRDYPCKLSKWNTGQVSLRKRGLEMDLTPC